MALKKAIEQEVFAKRAFMAIYRAEIDEGAGGSERGEREQR